MATVNYALESDRETEGTAKEDYPALVVRYSRKPQRARSVGEKCATFLHC